MLLRGTSDFKIHYCDSVTDIRNQRHLSCALYRNCKLTLMNSAGARNSSGQNLRAFADQFLQSYSIFVINIIDFVRTEETNFLLFPHRAKRTLSVFGCFVIH